VTKNPKIEQKFPSCTENTKNGENENTFVLTNIEKNILFRLHGDMSPSY